MKSIKKHAAAVDSTLARHVDALKSQSLHITAGTGKENASGRKKKIF